MKKEVGKRPQTRDQEMKIHTRVGKKNQTGKRANRQKEEQLGGKEKKKQSREGVKRAG